jgi:hypothetical protein
LGGHRRGVPLLHRLGSEEAQRAAGDQMALNIERVVDGRRFVASALHDDVKDLAFVIDRAPEVHLLATDPDHHLVEMPT